MKLEIAFSNDMSKVPKGSGVLVIENGQLYDRVLELKDDGWIWEDRAIGNDPEDYELENSEDFNPTHWVCIRAVNDSIAQAEIEGDCR